MTALQLGIKGVDFVNFHGKIKVLQGGKTISEVENQVTELWEEVVATAAFDFLYVGSSAIEAGHSQLFAPIGVNTQGYADYSSYQNNLITVYLLNLTTEEKAALSKKSNLLPVYASDFTIDPSKIVAYATATYTAENEKQGVVGVMSEVNLANYRRHGLKFTWSAGSISGEYNTIAVGFNIMTDTYNGCATFRGVEISNVALGEVAPGGYMACPNIKSADGSIVITKENEILIGGADKNNFARNVYNMVTGEITVLDSSDYRYDFPLGLAVNPQCVVNGNFIFNDGNSLYRVDVTEKSKRVLASTGYDCFVYNGYLYSRYSTTLYKAYSLSDFSAVASADLTIANMGFPAEYLAGASNFIQTISPLGDNFLVSYRYKYTISNTDTIMTAARFLVCSNPEDIQGSIIEILPYINSSHGEIINNTRYFFTHYTPDSTASKGYYKVLGTAIPKKGFKYTADGMYGNLLSYHTYANNQVIDTTQNFEIEYYYTFEI